MHVNMDALFVLVPCLALLNNTIKINVYWLSQPFTFSSIWLSYKPICTMIHLLCQRSRIFRLKCSVVDAVLSCQGTTPHKTLLHSFRVRLNACGSWIRVHVGVLKAFKAVTFGVGSTNRAEENRRASRCMKFKFPRFPSPPPLNRFHVQRWCALSMYLIHIMTIVETCFMCVNSSYNPAAGFVRSHTYYRCISFLSPQGDASRVTCNLYPRRVHKIGLGPFHLDPST